MSYNAFSSLVGAAFGGTLSAKNGEQVAVRDDREEESAWILARVIKYVPESHLYEVSDMVGSG